MQAQATTLQVDENVNGLVRKANRLTIATPDDYEAAVELGKAAAELRRKIVDFFKPLKKKADEAKRALLDQERDSLAPVETAEGILKQKVTAYRQAEEERRRAEVKRLENLSLKQAQKAINKGDVEKAEAILNKPIEVSSDVPKVSGIRRTVRWKYKILDSNQVPREFLTVDEVKLGQFVRSHKDGAIGKIPGVEVYSEEDTGF